MLTDPRAMLASIKRFDQLITYLRDEMGWPIESSDLEELTFDYTPEELGIDVKNAANIVSIKRLRPLSSRQPWGIFFVEFEPKKLPVVALRRILSRVTLKKRASANSAERTAWAANDLLFISNYGEGDKRTITLAHFSHDDTKQDLPVLKVLGWNDEDTALHLDGVANELTSKLAWPANEEDVETWRKQWRSAFTVRHREVITTSKDLSIHLAKLAQTIRKRINTALTIETEHGPLKKLMKAFKDALIHDLDADGFADMYAQTIAYGLLSARILNPKGGTADELHIQVPATNPFLKELMDTFLHVGGRQGNAGGPGIDFDELGVSEVVNLLDEAKMEAVIRDFGDRNPQEDPVIHFYELFLKEYDSKKRLQRGVFYTPRPVVSYIVRSVNELLRTEFGLRDGLADTTTWGEMANRHISLKIPEGTSYDQAFIQILDPATGTGTFLVETIDLIHRTMRAKWKAQGHSEKEIVELWNEYVPKHLLPRLHGYEIMMAPYAIAHLKIGLKLYETGYSFNSKERVRVYLTNSLDPASDTGQLTLDYFKAIAHEAQAVNEIKRKQRFTVIIGNPPYSKMSANLGPDAVALIEPFRFIDGERVVEKGALAFELNLQDDYVKFWGLLMRSLHESDVGIGAFITNSRYLDSPTLRGMRYYLSRTFMAASFLDLGGQVSERESSGIVDENVFDIEQGVCIGLGIRQTGLQSLNSVRFSKLVGSRAEKYNFLTQVEGKSEWSLVRVVPPFYRLTRSTDSFEQELTSWVALDVLMPFNSGAIITSRDNLAIDIQISTLLDKIDKFAESRRDDRSLEKELGYSVKSKWNVEACKASIRNTKDRASQVRMVLYRPFDHRYIYYSSSLLDTPSKPVCESVYDKDNLVLLTPRVKTTSNFSHALISREPAEKKACSHDRATQMFPLYRASRDLLRDRYSNIRTELLYKETKVTPEHALQYIYAVLYSPGYRARYGAALRDDYPHIPSTKNTDLFHALAHLGGELIALHLLESSILDQSITTYFDPKNPEVEKISWLNNTVWIDKAQTTGFKGVLEAVWEFRIGGYQVCEKWLKDRKSRTLSKDDLIHYQKIVVALAETIRLMQEIDEVIEQHGGWPEAFHTSNEKIIAPPKGLHDF